MEKTEERGETRVVTSRGVSKVGSHLKSSKALTDPY